MKMLCKCVLNKMLGTVICFFIISFAQEATAFKEDGSAGRVPEFDEILQTYSEQISKGKDMDHVLKHLKLTEDSLNNPDMNMVNYYYEVCKGVGKEGDAYIVSERNRHNKILEGTAVDTPAYEKELEYAYRRRNILESFIDSAAQAVMRQYGMTEDDSIMMTEDMMNQINLDDLDFTSEDGKPKTIKLDPSKFKLKKTKKVKHDEM